jgi:site-specific DNA recombinase
LKTQKVNIEEQKNRWTEYEWKIEVFTEIIERQKPNEKYDDQLVRNMVKEIRVISKARVVMELMTGLQVELGL